MNDMSGSVTDPFGPLVVLRPETCFHINLDTYIHLPYYGMDKEFERCFRGITESSLLSRERLWTIYLMARQSLNVAGSFFECGVYKGGTSLFLAKIMEGSDKVLHLFDTFCGMPKSNPRWDVYLGGEFSDAPIEEVRKAVGYESSVVFHEGLMPDTFRGMEDMKIAFAHIDVDIYQSMKDCCEFVYPRMVPGGVIVFDDYGHIHCDGATQAIDEYFSDKPSVPLSILTKQAIIFKLP